MTHDERVFCCHSKTVYVVGERIDRFSETLRGMKLALLQCDGTVVVGKVAGCLKIHEVELR